MACKMCVHVRVCVCVYCIKFVSKHYAFTYSDDFILHCTHTHRHILNRWIGVAWVLNILFKTFKKSAGEKSQVDRDDGHKSDKITAAMDGRQVENDGHAKMDVFQRPDQHMKYCKRRTRARQISGKRQTLMRIAHTTNGQLQPYKRAFTENIY